MKDYWSTLTQDSPKRFYMVLPQSSQYLYSHYDFVEHASPNVLPQAGYDSTVHLQWASLDECATAELTKKKRALEKIRIKKEVSDLEKKYYKHPKIWKKLAKLKREEDLIDISQSSNEATPLSKISSDILDSSATSKIHTDENKNEYFISKSSSQSPVITAHKPQPDNDQNTSTSNSSSISDSKSSPQHLKPSLLSETENKNVENGKQIAKTVNGIRPVSEKNLVIAAPVVEPIKNFDVRKNTFSSIIESLIVENLNGVRLEKNLNGCTVNPKENLQIITKPIRETEENSNLLKSSISGDDLLSSELPTSLVDTAAEGAEISPATVLVAQSQGKVSPPDITEDQLLPPPKTNGISLNEQKKFLRGVKRKHSEDEQMIWVHDFELRNWFFDFPLLYKPRSGKQGERIYNISQIKIAMAKMK